MMTSLWIFVFSIIVLFSNTFSTIFLDSSYQNADSDGSFERPWKTPSDIISLIQNKQVTDLVIKSFFTINIEILIENLESRINFRGNQSNSLMNFSLGGDFRIRNSSIKVEGVKIYGGDKDWQLKTLFFLENYSNFTLNFSSICNHSFSSSMIQNIDSSLYLLSSNFSNLSLNTTSLIMSLTYNANLQYKKQTLFIQNSSFTFINQTFSTLTSSIILIYNLYTDFSLISSNFSDCFIALDLIHIEATQSSIFLQYAAFVDNVVKGHTVNVISVINLTILDTNCSISNSSRSARNIIYTSIGGCFRSQNIIKRNFTNIRVFNSFSDKTTYGLIIMDDSGALESLITNNNLSVSEHSEIILIQNCKFYNNSNYINGDDDETAGAVYLRTDVDVYIKSSTFIGNLVSSNGKSKFMPTSPCLLSVNTANNVYITDSEFIENHSGYGSNCLSFLGYNLNITNSKFINNTDIKWINDTTSLKAGSSCDFEGRFLYVNSSLFQRNNGLIGGAFMISKMNYYTQTCIIQNSAFKENFSGNGGAIGVSENSLDLSMFIRNNYFFGNWGALGGSIRVKSYSALLYLNISENFFDNGLADMGAYMDLELEFSIDAVSNVFQNGIGRSYFGNKIGTGSVMIMSGGIDVRYSSYRGRNNKYLNGWGENKGTFAMFGGNFTENNSLFQNNYGLMGGTMFTTEIAVADIRNCLFIKQFTDLGGGAFGITDHSKFVFKNTTFINCFSREKAGTFYVSENSFLNISDSTVNNSFALYGSIFYLLENYNSKIFVDNCKFYNNTSIYNVIDGGDTTITITSSVFSNNINNLLFLSNSTLIFENSTVYYQICNSITPGCFISAQEDSNVTLLDSFIGGIESYIEEGNIYLDSSIFQTYSIYMNSSFTNKFKGSCISSYNSSVGLSDSEFLNYDYNCLYASISKIIINSSKFNNSGYGYMDIISNFGAFYCYGCQEIVIENSYFIRNMMILDGSAIYIDGTIGDIIIQGTKFIENQASGMGTVYVYNQNIKIQNCWFLSNQAEIGGGLFFDNDVNKNMNINIFDNVFENNTAKIDGGAIKWSDESPDLCNNTFINNSAIYGENIASFPIRIILNIYNGTSDDGSNSNVIFPQKDDILWNNTRETMLLLDNISSGNIIPYVLQFQVLDTYGKIVNLDNGKIELKLESVKEATSTPLIITGSNPKLISQGNAIINDLKLFFLPNNLITLSATSSVITSFHSKYLNQSISEPNSNSEYKLLFELKFRECIMGEYYRSDSHICQTCALGQYSFEDGMKANGCQKCPTNADECYLNVIVAKAGYWRRSLVSANLYYCNNYVDRCLGGVDSVCEFAYDGPLCSSCNHGYSHLGLNVCTPCQNKVINMISILGMFILFFAILTVFIIISVRQSDKVVELHFSKQKQTAYFDAKKGMSVYLKIFLNYLQMISIIESLDLKWPFYVRNYLDIYSNIGGVSTQLISFECLLQDYDINTESIYVQTLITLILPFAVVIVALAILAGIVLIKKGDKKRQQIRFVAILIIVCIFVQPSIIKSLFDNVTCENLDGENYLKANLMIDCSDNNQIKWTVLVIYPFMAFWIFFYPCVCILYLVHNRKNLDNYEMRAKFNFYISGYKSSLYYWEFFIMYRKIIFIAINLLPISSFTKVTLLILLASFAFLVTFLYQPFTFQKLNVIEFYSLLSAIITLYSGALYISDVNDTLKALSFLTILMVNLAFCFTWLLSLTSIVFSSNIKKLQNLFPQCTYRLIACIMSFQTTKKNVNLVKYFRDVTANYSSHRRSIIKKYESDEVSDMSTIIAESKKNKKSMFTKNFGNIKQITPKVIKI